MSGYCSFCSSDQACTAWLKQLSDSEHQVAAEVPAVDNVGIAACNRLVCSLEAWKLVAKALSGCFSFLHDIPLMVRVPWLGSSMP